MAARSDSLTDESEINQEIEVLKHIYIEELEVILDDDANVNTIKVLLHPSTCEDTSVQYVCLTLVFNIPHTYPHDVPEIFIKNPRGLAEEEVKRLHDDIVQLAEERRGAPMLFELIELGKESLTEGNIPRCECVVCLEHFHEGDVFTKTVCYHYFHCHCLGRYVKHSLSKSKEKTEQHQKEEKEEGIVCPVCRTPIEYDLKELSDAPAPVEDSSTLEISKSIRQLQEKMKELYKKQKEKGGIIDVEAEKNKFLISELEQNPEDLAESINDAQATAQIPDDISVPKSNSINHVKQAEENKFSSQEGLSTIPPKDKPTRRSDGRSYHYKSKDQHSSSSNRTYGDRYYGNKENKEGGGSSHKESYRDRYYGKKDSSASSDKERYRDRYYGNRNNQHDRYYGSNRDTQTRNNITQKESYKNKYYGKERDDKQASQTKSYRDKYYGSGSGKERTETKRKDKEDYQPAGHGHFKGKDEAIEGQGQNSLTNERLSSSRGRGRRTHFPSSDSHQVHVNNKTESVDRNKMNADERHQKNDSKKTSDIRKGLPSAEKNVNQRDQGEGHRRGQGQSRVRGRGRDQSSHNSKTTYENHTQGGDKNSKNRTTEANPPPGFKPIPNLPLKDSGVKPPPGFSNS